MNMQITFVCFAVCGTLLCLTIGAPTGGSEKREPSKLRGKNLIVYSPEENDFIINEVVAQAKIYKTIPWKHISQLHERKVENKEQGFTKKRSGDSLRKHFEHLKMRIPDWKYRKTSNKRRYTNEEEEFINKELLNDSFRTCSLYGDEIWQAISDKHNLKRSQKCKGFLIERSLNGLRSHFMISMRPGQRVAPEVKERYPMNFRNDPDYTTLNKNVNIDHRTGSSEDTLMEGTAEDNEIFGIILKDLASLQKNVDADGIDPDLFMDP